MKDTPATGRLVAILLSTLTALSPALPQTGAGRTEFPASAQGGLGRAFIDCLNDPDPGATRRFVSSRLSARALKERAAGDWTSLLAKLSERSGGVEVTNVAPEDSLVLSIEVRTNAGGNRARFVVISSRSEPGKMSDLFVLPALDPAAEADLRFPDRPPAPSELAAVIDTQASRRAAMDRFSGTVLVAKGDSVLFAKAYGYAERSWRIPNAVETKYHLGSMDKMFTGVAIAQLVREGRLSFDDTLSTVLPEFPDRAMARRITIRQILTHTAGTGDFIADPEFRARREGFRSVGDYLPMIAREGLSFEPGERFSYSNSGYVILGAVVEKVSGVEWFEYVKSRIFGPAGMENTGYYELNEIVPGRATGYLRDPSEDPFGTLPRRSNVMFIPFRGNSAGGGYSTAPDLLRFSIALRSHRLLDAALTDTVTSGKVDMAGAPRPERYGFGFAQRTIGGKDVRGMGGGGPASGVDSGMKMFWGKEGYTVIVMGNYDAPSADELLEAIAGFLAGL